MEFGLHEEFPIYAGGLGILAGDFLKTARDLGLPVVGVGLRWARGYSRQRIGDDGTPVDEFPAYSADILADTGARVRVRVAEREVEARDWRTERWGNAPLLLLEPVGRRTRGSHTDSTSPASTGASRRRSCSAWAACARSPRSGWRSTPTTSTRAMPSSPASQ